MLIKKDRKVEIIEAAITLFSKNGFEDTSVLDICNSINITRSTFYYYFKTKEDVLDLYFLTTDFEAHEYIQEMVDSKTFYDQFINIFNIYLKRTVDEGPNMFRLVIRRFVEGKNDLLNPKTIVMRDIYISLIHKAQLEKQIENFDDPEYLIDQISYTSIAMSAYWCHMDGDFNYISEMNLYIIKILKPKKVSHT